MLCEAVLGRGAERGPRKATCRPGTLASPLRRCEQHFLQRSVDFSKTSNVYFSSSRDHSLESITAWPGGRDHTVIQSGSGQEKESSEVGAAVTGGRLVKEQRDP